MRWWPWRRAPQTEPVTTTVLLDQKQALDEAFFSRLDNKFTTMIWAQEVLRTVGMQLDEHCNKHHDYFSDCDPLCGPGTITDLLQELTREELHNFTTLLIKQWYACYVTLRFQQNQGS